MSFFIKRFFSKPDSVINKLLLGKLSISQQALILGKLGLYRTILINPKYRCSYVYIIALYAYGYREQARKVLDNYKKTQDYQINQLNLIKALLPFDAELSYSLLGEIKLDKDLILLKANILASLGKQSDLRNFLSSLKPKLFMKKPELFLVYNHLINDNVDKLKNLNQYLSSYGLAEVILEDERKSLFIANLAPKLKENNYSESLPLVSIIMTTHNSEAYVIPALKSLIDQTYPNKEIIVVDDKSSDNTISCLQALAREYSFIRIISLKRNIGTYAAKTIGTYVAQGEFIATQDSDDWAHPQKIELQIKPLLQNTGLVVTFSKWARLTDSGVPYARSINPLTRLNPASALFRKKEVIQKIGLWDLVRTGADSEFNERLKLAFPKKYITIDKPLTIGAHRENSLMTAKNTGYSANGISIVRLEYWEAWRYWHLQCIKQGKLPKLRHFQRPFVVPNELEVNQDDIKFCIKNVWDKIIDKKELNIYPRNQYNHNQK